jgi:hypothetical protein
LVLSQALIAGAWAAAKAGTLANVLVTIAITLALGQARCERDAREPLDSLLRGVPAAVGPPLDQVRVALPGLKEATC